MIEAVSKFDQISRQNADVMLKRTLQLRIWLIITKKAFCKLLNSIADLPSSKLHSKTAELAVKNQSKLIQGQFDFL